MTRDAPPPAPVVGIFVGGAARRMGGQPKGLLPAPGGAPIVERWRALAAAVGLRCVLVGGAEPYAALGIATVADARAGAGPLGGLVALLRAQPAPRAIAVACDMPYVTAALLERLAYDAPDAAVLAPERDGRFEPLFARYDCAAVLPLAERQLDSDDLSLQKLLRLAGARPLAVSPDEWPQLADWDEPGDLRRP
jgi:molybdopterin-guanine dinucleotide biosynthesis protein A